METPSPKPKETWITPQVIEINTNQSKEEEMENWLRMLNDPEAFQRLVTSSPDGRM
jgi:hypothetical protein